MKNKIRYSVLVAMDILLLGFLLFLIVHQRGIWEGRENDLKKIKDLEYQLNYESSLLLPTYLDPLEESYRKYSEAVRDTEREFGNIGDLPYLNRILGPGERLSDELREYQTILSEYQQALLESLMNAREILSDSNSSNTYQIISINDFAKRRWLLDRDDPLGFSDFLDFRVISHITDLNVALFAGIERIDEKATGYGRTNEIRRQADILIIIFLTNLFLIPHLVSAVVFFTRIRSERALTEARSLFFSTISHELRTPLNVIIGLAHLMGKGDLSVPQREKLRKLAMTSQDLLSLINDVLDYTKLESRKMTLEKKPYSPARFINRMADLYSPLIEEKGLSLVRDIDPDLPEWVYGDDFRLQQIMANLISNGVKFTREGSITLGASLLSPLGSTAWIRYSVADTGLGIPPEKRDRLFQPYSQVDSSTSRKFGGTGLGLSISARFISLMGGQIEASENPGGGTRFTADIPCPLLTEEEMDRLTREEEEGEQDGSIRFPGSRVLLVEDHPINREIMEELLKERGIEVISAKDGAEGIEKWETGDFDMVFMDVQMPVMDGYAATEGIRSREGAEEHIPIIAMTAFAMAEDRERSLRAGMDGHIAKPIILGELNRSLNTWLAPYRQAGEEGDRRIDFTSRDILMREFPDIDIPAALERVGGNLPVYLDLLREAAEEGEGNSLRLEEFLTRPASEEAGRLCHTWRGVLANLGADALSRELRDWEVELKSASIPEEDRRRDFYRRCGDLGERVKAVLPLITSENKPEGGMEKGDRERKRLLLVDDTPGNIRMIMALLGDRYDYNVARDGQKALTILEKVTPDLMLVDVMMPGMDGFAFCRRVKSQPGLAPIPLIFLTALDGGEDERAGREAGAADFIYKPFDPARLKSAVESALRDPVNPGES